MSRNKGGMNEAPTWRVNTCPRVSYCAAAPCDQCAMHRVCFLCLFFVLSRKTMSLFHALIRTHHITSRKKVAHLRKAAKELDVYALLRSGGCPGIMYCKGDEEGVKSWVGTVQVSPHAQSPLQPK